MRSAQPRPEASRARRSIHQQLTRWEGLAWMEELTAYMCWMLTSGCVKQSSKVGGRGGGAGGGQGAAGGRDGRLGGLAGGSSGLAGDSGGLGAAGSGDWGLRGAGVEGGEGGEPGGMGGRKGLVERNVAIVMERASSVNSREVEVRLGVAIGGRDWGS